MGAFSQDPAHFLRWVRDRGTPAGELDFLPRGLFRDYLLTLMREALEARGTGTAFDFIRGEAIDLRAAGGCTTIDLTDGSSLVADKVVLALGNFPPPHPRAGNPSLFSSPRYVRDPWSPGVLDPLSPGDTVFLIGTGQTTVDVLMSLHRRAQKGRIIALSRRGLLPLGHRGFESYPSFIQEMRESNRVRHHFRTVRRHMARARSSGIDIRSVIDALRPHTQDIWHALPEAEKRRFLRHVFRYWEIVRSRIPPKTEAVVGAMRASGQLEIRAGRIRDLIDTGDCMEVHYGPRGGDTELVENAALVINTVGPECDYGRVDDALVRNLLQRGLIRPGPAGLGMDALPGGTIIGRDGVVSDVLHTLGPAMKGVLWEVLAVPEIRLQAERLARALLLSGGDGWREMS
jgi:uncharacterized NAD(P)/FAD-binding protein YdhS